MVTASSREPAGTFLVVGVEACFLLVDSGLELKKIGSGTVSKKHAFVRINKDCPVATNCHISQDVAKYFENIREQLFRDSGEHLILILLQLQLGFHVHRELDEALAGARYLADKLKKTEMAAQAHSGPFPESARNSANWSVVDPIDDTKKASALRRVLVRLGEHNTPDDIRRMMVELINAARRQAQTDRWHQPRNSFVAALEAVKNDLSQN